MMEKGLVGFFESFVEKESLFSNKRALQSSYTPETIQHRDIQIKKIANILAPSLRFQKPSNVFIYGKTGTGKTAVTKYITKNILYTAKKKNIPIKIFYLNCKLKRTADTEYRLMSQLASFFGKAVPSTGLPTDEVYKIFFDVIDKDKQMIILVLDEIDQLINKAGDSVLYNLTRINEDLQNSQISMIGISNDLLFADKLDPRVKSSLSEEEIVFSPYNALQIQDILRERSNLAFKENTIENGVIEKCAAYAARDHGDARRALELLRVSGEIAERNNQKQVKIEHIDEAEENIEKDRIFEIIGSQPKQYQVTMYSIITLQSKRNFIFTGEIYEFYKQLCNKIDLRPLTQRRISDILAEFDILGMINAKVISKGRYGRTREITLSVNKSTIPNLKKILEESLGF